MAMQEINLGTAPNGAGGDDRRSAWQKAIANFKELYEALAKTYNKSNILGPVSQSGGTPTGAIIQTGTFTGGRWTKFADGTMECVASINIGSVAITDAAGGGWFYAQLSALALAPGFIAAPEFIDITVRSGSGLVQSSMRPGGTANASPTWFVMSPTSITTSIVATLFARGRWF